MSTSPAFSLYEGCDYKMFISTGKLYNVQVGVWVDLNMDNDFSDSGEFLSKGWTEINSDGQLHSRSFQIRCGVITTGTTRMRIRTDSAGSAKWDSAGACTSVKYGETEDYTINIDVFNGVKNNGATTTSFVAYPNPSHGISNVSYTLTEKSNVNFELYNLVGKLVASTPVETKNSGKYQTDFDFNQYGISAGVYFLKLNAGVNSKTIRVVLE